MLVCILSFITIASFFISIPIFSRFKFSKFVFLPVAINAILALSSAFSVFMQTSLFFSMFLILTFVCISIFFVLKDLLSGVKAESQIPYLKQLQEKQEEYQLKGPEMSKVTGIATHFTDLDNVINGMNNSNLVILAARPAMGKTALALNIAENICFKNKMPVGIFSLEMSAEQLLHRVICSHSQVESDKIKTGSINGSEYQSIVSSVNAMLNQTMIIDDQPGLKITDLRARARRMKEAFDIQFLVIDYLQLLSGSGTTRSQENRQNEISEISRLLKNLARELNIPVLCLSQLSRKVEERVGHRPMMSDLRESGSIEQDSDIVMFLLRREYYDPYDKPGQGELIVAKNRHGSVGNINLTFRKEIAQFANFTQEHEYVEA
jgi:replicative DNA helicase